MIWRWPSSAWILGFVAALILVTAVDYYCRRVVDRGSRNGPSPK